MNLTDRWRAQLQDGQAVVEAMITLAVLMLVLTAVSWLGRYQDIALQASHASRYAAFATTRAQPQAPGAIWHDYFGAPDHRWSDRRGRLLLESERQLAIQINRDEKLSPLAQPGQMGADTKVLREQWSVADEGIVDARASVAFFSRGTYGVSREGLFGAGLREFDAAYPTLVRHTAILTGVGHASSAEHAQQRVGDSAQAWGDASSDSYRLANQIQTVMNPVDAGWGRARPAEEWLRAWIDVVPEHHRLYGDQP